MNCRLSLRARTPFRGAKGDHKAVSYSRPVPKFAKGFDAIIGNPPYVRMELIKPQKPFLKRHYRCHAERADLFIYFYERAVCLLRPGGRMALIAPSTWTKTKAGERLRDFLKTETALDSVLDFGDLPVFEGATTYSCILVASRQKPAPGQMVASAVVPDRDATDLGRYLHTHSIAIPQSELKSTGWHFEDRIAARLRDKIRGGGISLREYCGFAPMRGIVSGLTGAFVIDTPTRDRIVAEDRGSVEILKPYLEGKDIQSWRAEWRGLWLIYAQHGLDISRYPGVRAHLEPYRSRLERRATSDQHEWFELQQPQLAYTTAMRKPKIMYPDITSHPRFVFDDQGFFFGNTTYFIPGADRYLQGLLHSNVLWWYLRSSVRLIRGGYSRLFTQYVGALPIVRAKLREKAIIGGLAERLSSETSSDRFALGAELNDRIRALYGLNDEEAKLVTRDEST